MRHGSVALHAPAHTFQSPGGGEVQLVQTGRHLEAHGLDIRPLNAWTDKLGDARLLHLFGMSHEGLALARTARALGVRVVLSPICWFEPRALFALARTPLHGAGDLGRWALRLLAPRLPSWRRSLFGLADAVLPNSPSEARQLARLFGVPLDRLHVVPNGVDDRFGHAEPGPFRELYGSGGFILYTGRIEPRKNVLGLVRAARLAGLPLVVVGAVVPGYEEYARSCRRASVTVRWLPGLAHDDPLLESAYAAARVFALPSWFETPGLAALEAARAGCAIVITPYGSTRDYFGHRVQYAAPARPSAIARALAAAWHAGPDPQLAASIGRHYSWTAVARKTMEVYDRVAP
jgi:glycosyltransferase involved in cell wall biosynthesis